jgi:hypothetical protein
MHPNVSTCIADKQRNVQPMWGTEQNASKVVHKYCRSTIECPTHVKYRAEWSAILVDTLGCILLCTSHGVNILLLIRNTCGHHWMYSALYFTCMYCKSTTECPTHVKYRAEYIQWCPQVLRINNRMFTPCEVQSRMHPRVSTSIADQQQNVQPMCSTEQNTSNWTPLDVFCSVLHMGWTFCCWSAILVDTPGCILLGTSHNNRMFNPCEVQSRIHPGVSSSIADQQQNVQPMWSTEQNTSRDVHKYLISWVGHSVVYLQYMWTHLDAFCSVPHIVWTFHCWSAILVDTLVWRTEQNASKGVHK